MNTDLLLQVKDRILSFPEQFDMDYWDSDECGTTHCIGGWALQILTEQGHHRPVDAWIALGLSLAQGDRLFFQSKWPEPYRRLYEKATTKTERAKIAAERIDHFIEKRGDLGA